MKPVGMILPPAKSLCRALELAYLAATGCERPEVLEQSPAAQASLAGNPVPVKTTTIVEESRQSVHQTVYQVAGAMAAEMRIGNHILRFPIPELRHHLQNRFGPCALQAPRAECRHPLAKLAGSGRTVHFPHALVQFKGLTAPVTNLQETVQETEDQRDGRKQRAEGVTGGKPTIGINGLRSIVLLHGPRFLGKLAVGIAQVRFVSGAGQSQAQDTSSARRHGYVTLLAEPV